MPLGLGAPFMYYTCLLCERATAKISKIFKFTRAWHRQLNQGKGYLASVIGAIGARGSWGRVSIMIND